MANTNKIPEKFLFAAELMFPDLKSGDSRLVEVAKYAQKSYSRSGKQNCVLVAIKDARAVFPKRFHRFCQNLGIDPGKREVIISGDDVLFSHNYGKRPEEVVY